MKRIIGGSKEIKEVIKGIKTVIEYDLPVIIYGETGTGKELVAQALHYNGPRKKENFCAINASCISETIAESELFGHVKGAFTGAINDHEGRFEFANRGTIFLDEIDCISSNVQAKILRVIEDQTFQRVGSNETMVTDVRIISASNTDLQEEVFKKNFREDLFYRIAVFSIEVPPLRKRKEDIPDLCRYFLEQWCTLIKSEEKKIDSDAMEKLMEYHWPGNIRELQNIIKVAVLRTKEDTILPEHFTFSNGHKNLNTSPMYKLAEEIDSGKSFSLEKVASTYIKEILDANNGNVSKVARIIGINRSTLQKRLNSRVKKIKNQ